MNSDRFRSDHSSKGEIVRRRLLDRIGLGPGPRLTLIQAPVGYGKSVLSRQWASRMDHAVRVSPRHIDVCAHTATEDSVLAARLHALIERCGSNTCQHADAPEAITEVLASFFLEVEAVDAPCGIVLDDVDCSPACDRLLGAMLLAPNMPPQLRIVAITKRSLRHPIGPLTVAGEFQFIAAGNLAMTRPEIEQVLVANHAGAPVEADLDAICAQTCGWPAGVRLMVSSFQAVPEATSRQAIDDYIEVAMLPSLPEGSRDLVMASAELPALWDEIWSDLTTATGRPSIPLAHIDQIVPTEALGKSESLGPARRGIPIVAMGLQRLFRDRIPGSASLRAQVLDRAMAWYVQHDQHLHAYAVASTSDRWASALDALAEEAGALAVRNQDANLIALLGHLPDHALVRHDDLAFWMALSLFTSGQHARGRQLLVPIDAGWSADPTPLRQGRRALLDTVDRVFTGDREGAIAAARDAFTILPPCAHSERMRAAATLEDLSFYLGNIDEAREWFTAALVEREHLPWDQRWWITFVLPNQADHMAMSGNLVAASELYTHQRQVMEEAYPQEGGLLLTRLARIAIEQNDLARAAKLLDSVEVEPAASYWRQEYHLTSARLHQVRGNSDDARAILYHVIHEADRFGADVERRRPRAQLAQLWIDEGELDLANAWAEEELLRIDTWPRSFGLPIPVAIKAQLRIAQQRWSDAHPLLDRLIAEGEKRRQPAPLVRTHALKALAYGRAGQIEACHQAISTAMQIGARGRFHHAFMVSGFDTRHLLASPELTDLLASSGARDSPIVLSEREREVLALVARGMTNDAIGDALFISGYTVKNHLARIYNKLSVRNRVEVVIAARNLGLIDNEDTVPRS